MSGELMPDDEQPEQESWKPCAMCAGTGKIRDRGDIFSPFGARTSFTIDSDLFKDYDFRILYGT
jgi:hypothetical protein